MSHVAGVLVPARATGDERVRCHFELPQQLSSTVAEAGTPLLSFFVICCTTRDETGGFRSQLHSSRNKFPRRWMHCQCELRPVFCKGLSRTFFRHRFFSMSDIGVNTFTSLRFQGPQELVSVCHVRPSLAKSSCFFSVFRVSLSCGLCCLCLCVLFSFSFCVVLAFVLSVCVFVMGHVVGQFAECTPRRTLYGDTWVPLDRGFEIFHSQMSATFLLPAHIVAVDRNRREVVVAF